MSEFGPEMETEIIRESLNSVIGEVQALDDLLQDRGFIQQLENIKNPAPENEAHQEFCRKMEELIKKYKEYKSVREK